MAKIDRKEWKRQILEDYPNLKQIEHTVDILMDLYEKDPDRFKKDTKEMEHKEAKKARKSGGKEEVQPTIEPKIIEGAITKGVPIIDLSQHTSGNNSIKIT